MRPGVFRIASACPRRVRSTIPTQNSTTSPSTVESLPRPATYLVGCWLVQCSCATLSVHAEPSGENISQVSASLPASIR